MTIEGFSQWTGLVIDPVLLVAPDGVVVEVNEAAADMLGIPTEPSIPLGDLLAEPPEAVARHLATWLDDEGAVVATTLHVRIPGADPSAIAVRATSICPPGDGRRFAVVRFVDDAADRGAALRDAVARLEAEIEQHRRTEDRLRRRDTQFSEAQRIARVGSWTWDPPTGAITISPELDEILGGDRVQPWTIERLVKITHPDDLGIASSALISARAGTATDRVFRVRREDATTLWLRLISEASPGAGGPVSGTIQDVTEREEAEQRRADLERRLRHAQRLESVGQLAGGIAHDFNNLLAVMSLHADLAQRALDADHAAAESLAQIRQAIEHATALTQQLLLFSRQEPTELQLVDLNQVIGEVTTLLRRTLAEHIELDRDLAPDLPPISADRTQVEQVLVNLALNARDAMPAGGRLTIRTATVRAGDIDTGDIGTGAIATGDADATADGGSMFVKLTVADTGVGMPSDVVERAFEPYFTTKPTGHGSGLGLATVHGVVVRSGGAVDIRSAPGAGTVVEILFPAAQPQAATEPAAVAAVEDSPVTGETVLVVEDLESLGEVVASLLRRAGYRVLVANDGATALRLATSEGHVDLLLTDVVMPQMSGLEVAQRLRAERPELPVVFMSGYTHGILDDWPPSIDPPTVLAKPFSTSELLGAVAAELAERRPAGDA